MEDIDPFMAYLNSRVRGMRSRLFTREQYEQLLDADGTTGISDQLLASPYQHEMAEALTRYQGADAIEDAASRNLVHTYERLLRVTQGLSREVAEIFFNRWDLIAVKSLLRHRHHGLDADSGEGALVPGPTLSVALLNEFSSQSTMDALVRSLVGWNAALCKGLLAVLPEYNESNDVRVLEDRLDRDYFVKNTRALKDATDESSALLRTTLQMEIDRINVRTVLGARDSDEVSEHLFARLLPGGLLHRSSLEQMAQAKSPEQVIEILGTSRYREVHRGLVQLIHANRLSPMERLFEHVFIRELGRLSRTHVLSIAILLHYTWLKYNEVINLRVIARGGANHLPKGRVREEILYA